jgi:hypothetical protein
MTDYVIGPPPNLRAVDCCAMCAHVKAQGPSEVACGKFLKPPHEASVSGYFRIVPSRFICDAFERRKDGEA